jgi:hypothetical protein
MVGRGIGVNLKETVLPLLTLMSVAKPWMLGSPDPLTSHWLEGLPGFVFSQAIGLAMGASHGPDARVSVGSALIEREERQKSRMRARVPSARRPWCRHRSGRNIDITLAPR